MMKVLFSALTMIILFLNFGEPNPRMMSIYGDVDFLVKDKEFSAQDTVGYMYDDVDGDFALNPSYCTLNRKGSACFQAYFDCTVTAYCDRSDVFRDFGVKYEPDFPDASTGSNILYGVSDVSSPFTTSFSTGGDAFRFADINDEISLEYSTIQCNNKSETHYKYLFAADADRPGQIIFNGSDVSLYDRTLKCFAQLYDNRNQLLAGKLFVLTISDIPELIFSFPSTTLSIDDSTFFVHNSTETTGTWKDNIYRLPVSFKSNFVFRATLFDQCTVNITIEVGEKKSSVIALRYDHKHYTMPAIHADDSLRCGVQENENELYEYWCDCSQSTEQID